MAEGAEGFDVFLSHSSDDVEVVERVAERLRACGVRPWLDTWQLVGGDRFQRAIESGLDRCSGCAVFLGASGFRPWVQEEIDYAADRAVTGDGRFRLFLVLLPGAPEAVDRAGLPPGLRTRSWVDMRTGIDAGLQDLLNAIKGEAPPPSRPVAADGGEVPYKGLAPFGRRDARFFRGREPDVQQLLELLRAGRFVAVVGPSGAGKSSLVRAGLLPALADGRLPGSAGWPAHVLRPGPQPLARLAGALGSLLPGRATTSLLDELEDRRSLDLEAHKILAGGADEARLVWVVDQFEELFTTCRDDHQRDRFLAALLYAATVPGGRSVVVVTMRSDFYGEAAAHPELATLLGGRHHLVGPLEAEHLRRAVEDPARSLGLDFQPGLVERILADVPVGAGSLPLLQDGLLELWHRRRHLLLTHEAYDALGGVGGSLARRADRLYCELSGPEQEETRFILTHRLIRVDERGEAVAQPAAVADLVPHGEDPAATRRLVDRLAAARLVTVGRDHEPDGDSVEVIHEALVRAWPRLGRWIDQDRADLIEHRVMAEAAGRWAEHGQDPAYLFRGERLRTVVRSVRRFGRELNDDEQAFLRASLTAERGAVRTRYLGQAGGGAVGTALGFALALSLLFIATTDHLSLGVLLFLAAWPLGLAVGLVVGMSPWFLRGWNRSRRALLAAVAGAVVGAGTYAALMYVYVGPDQAFAASQFATGALLAAPLGVAVGGWSDRRGRAVALLVAGVAASGLALLPGEIDPVWWSVPLAGLVLGALAATGFAVVHVSREEQAVFEFEEG